MDDLDTGATNTWCTGCGNFGILNAVKEAVRTLEEKGVGRDGIIMSADIGCHGKIFDYLDGDDTVLEQEPLQRLADDGQLVGYRHDGFFYAMDTFREYQTFNEMWESGKAPWKVWA